MRSRPTGEYRVPTTTTGLDANGEAIVDLGAIGHNTSILAAAAAQSGAVTLAVVKADGFGHGMVQTARTALASGASWLGVATMAEALELRNAGIDAPILAWLLGVDEDFETLIGCGIDLSVSSLPHLRAISAAGQRLGTPAQVHIKADTGLTRNGVFTDDWDDVVSAARAAERMGGIRVRGIYSHLASADDPGNPSIEAQLAAFDDALAKAARAGLDPELRHLANTPATLALPRAHFDLVRVGCGLYGVEPFARQKFDLRYAMSLRSKVANVKRVPPGTGVSYLHEFVTTVESTMALLPLGYADGIPWLVKNRAEVLVRGARRRIVGRVAMDQCVVDVENLPVEIGDEILLFGTGDAGEPVVDEWGRWSGGVNPIEIWTRIGRRVPKTYLPLPVESEVSVESQANGWRSAVHG
jgi:alanine racemase